MSAESHTFDDKCLLSIHSKASTPHPTRRDVERSPNPPRLKARFFFNSALPIDDPLSPIPQLPTTSGSRVFAPRPFSVHDNDALEAAWLRIHSTKASSPTRRPSSASPHSLSPPLRARKADLSPPRDAKDDAETLRNMESAAHVTGEPSHLVRSSLQRRMAANSHNTSLKPLEQASEEQREVQRHSLPNMELAASRPSGSSGYGPESEPPSGLGSSNDVVSTSGIPKNKSTFPVSTLKVMEETGSHGSAVRNSLLPSKHNNSGQEPKYKSTSGLDDQVQLASMRSSPQIKNKSSYSRPIKQQTSFTRETGPKPQVSSHDAKQARTKEVRFADDPSVYHTEGSSPAASRIGAMENLTEPTDPPISTSSPISSLWPSSDEPHMKETAEVPVGISRLHLVDLPALQMKPIYWSPVHDVSAVVRGTWFHKNSMYPVESDVANLLEIGYEYMKPWSREYTDEINSCLHHGPEAESKLTYPLWPKELLSELLSQLDSQPESANSGSPSRDILKPKQGDTSVADQIRAMYADRTKHKLPKSSLPDVQPNAIKSEVLSDLQHRPLPSLTPVGEVDRRIATRISSLYENIAVGDLDFGSRRKNSKPIYWDSKVIFANDRDAQILRPSQLPSPGTLLTPARRPLGPIHRGKIIGIPVIRGFDHKLWGKLYPADQSKVVLQARAGAKASRSGTAATQGPLDVCPACAAVKNRPKVTDLILVIHGIGQKLSERVESFNFTHSINSLRRQINVELGSGALRDRLREDLGGIMVLPVNWRSTVSLDDEHDDEVKRNAGKNEFGLKDITAPAIPAVRNLISDVLLDIPYYFSVDHKPKMIAAVVKEANRIYRRWCLNNPDFADTGRVHLIAHSLGSVMAVDILSHQPTQLPTTVDLTSKHIPDDMFEFDTKSLFFCGSPTGFFLLLNKASLIPRKGREKPGSDTNDALSIGHEGEARTWGCMAVDNVYNIMHKNDPIAYRLNACVSVSYSNSLLPATVPNWSAGWLQSLSSSIGLGDATGVALPAAQLDTPRRRPANPKLPSTMELETHNFSEEEIAEKKMYRLNDNGQIDYYLSTGGGPLEIQYWNMLGAHSSYWELREFVRFIVVEVGRKFGRENTFGACRAVKKGWQGGKEPVGLLGKK